MKTCFESFKIFFKNPLKGLISFMYTLDSFELKIQRAVNEKF